MDHMISSENDQLYSKKVLEMITVSNEYCLFLEKADEYSFDHLANFLQKISPLIYLKASLLPEIEPSDEDAIEHFVTEEQWESMFNVLRNKFGIHDQFDFIDYHEKSHSDPVHGSLSECYTDIYQDLKDFLLLYQKPLRPFKENAVRECRKLFETRFGSRIVTAHAVLHHILHDKEPEENYL